MAVIEQDKSAVGIRNDINKLALTGGSSMSAWRRKNAARKLVIIGDSTTDRFAVAYQLYARLDGHASSGSALAGTQIVDFGSNGNTGSGWVAGGGRLVANPITNVTLSGGVASITYSTTGTAPNILYLLRPGDRVRVANVAGITGLPTVATVIANSGSASSYTATIAAPDATGTFSATGSPTIAVSGILADLPTDADLYILRYGINDVRTGAKTLAQLTQTIIDCVDAIAAVAPTTAQVVLGVPNTLTADDYNTLGYVTLTGQWAGMTMAVAAQAASTMMRDAYYAAWNARPQCLFIDFQAELFGLKPINKLVASGSNFNVRPLMGDQLHQSAVGNNQIADTIAARLDVRPDRIAGNPTDGLFSNSASLAAHNENFAYPFFRYGPSLLDSRYWNVTSLGVVGGVGSNYIDVFTNDPADVPIPNWATNYYSTDDMILVGDQAVSFATVLNQGGYIRIFPQGSASWSSLGLTTPQIGQGVWGSRSKSARSVKARAAMTDLVTYPWQRLGFIDGVVGDGSYIDVKAFPGEQLASTWGVLATDTMFVRSESQTISLTGATISTDGVRQRITKTAGYFFTAISGMQVAILGAAR